MPVAVLSFPSLVQERICKEMNYSQLTAMSFCSLRMRKLIEFLSLTVPKLRYNSEDMHLRCEIPLREDANIVLVVRKNFLLEADTQEINLGGVKINGRFSSKLDKKGDIYYIIDVPRIDETIERAMQEHINSLFHRSGPNSLVIKMSSHSQIFPSLYEVADSYIRGKSVDMKVLEDHFANNPNHHSVNIEAVINGEISEDSEIWNIEALSIRKQEAGMFLRRFTGRHLHLRHALAEASDVIFLLETWISSRYYLNLKTLYISWKESHWLAYNGVMNRFQLTTRQEPSERPSHFKYDPQIIGMGSSNIELRTHNVFEIRRIDGKKAFLHCHPKRIWLFVSDEPK